jgi:hypothetical protein
MHTITTILVGVLLAVVLALCGRVLSAGITPTAVNPAAGTTVVTVRAWRPVHVVQQDGTGVWIIPDHAGTLLLPLMTTAATPGPTTSTGGAVPPAYAP